MISQKDSITKWRNRISAGFSGGGSFLVAADTALSGAVIISSFDLRSFRDSGIAAGGACEVVDILELGGFQSSHLPKGEQERMAASWAIHRITIVVVVVTTAMAVKLLIEAARSNSRPWLQGSREGGQG